MTESNKKIRGFAAMSPEKQREIASRAGKAAHAKGTAHEFTPEEGREAGRKGGLKVAEDKAHMSEIGKKGGAKSAASRAKAKAQRDTNRNDLPTS